MDWSDDEQSKRVGVNIATAMVIIGLAAIVLGLLLGVAYRLFEWVIS